MKSLGFIGRLIYSVPLLLFGFGHLGNASSMTGMVPDYFPGKLFLVYLTGVALILAAIANVINKKARLAGILLGIMLLLFALLIHLPGISESQASFSNLLKDSAMAGGAFFIAAHSKK